MIESQGHQGDRLNGTREDADVFVTLLKLLFSL